MTFLERKALYCGHIRKNPKGNKFIYCISEIVFFNEKLQIKSLTILR